MRNKLNSSLAIVLCLLFLWFNQLICLSNQEQSQIDDPDFIKVPQNIIQFRILHVLIKPTETILFERATRVKTEPGKSAEYSLLMPFANKDYYKIKLTPFIIEGKGIDLKIEISDNEKIIKTEKVFTRNSGTVVIELFENAIDHTKYAEQIETYIQTLEPAKLYPGPLPPITLKTYRLYMNDKLISERRIEGDRNFVAVSAKYIGFYVPKKGAYILSFSPFKGAYPVGVANYNIVKLRQGGDYFEFLSMRQIVPDGKWLVWVRHNQDYDPTKNLILPKHISEDVRITTKSDFQKNLADVIFWFSSDEKILEMVFGKER